MMLAALLLSATPAWSGDADADERGSARAEVQALTNEQFLDEWAKRSFLFLWEQADPATGLVADRAPADGSRQTDVASIASVGFALSGIVVADDRGWITSDDAYERVLTTLRFLHDDMPHVRGFYYHFVDIHTGERVWECELSSVDTALLMAGVLTAGEYYAGTEAADLAERLYERIDWPWMLNGGRTLSLGWKPESGFIPYYWENYSEHLILQLLGLGSPTHPLPPETWHAWRRSPLVQYDGMSFLSHPPLFVHQFSHAWVDFRGLRDDYADYWYNSVLATRAQRRMAISMRDKFPHYGENLWGITSSDSEYGYTAWGGPEPSEHVNGTVVPCAAAGSIPFLPEKSIAAVRHMYETYGEQIWQKYGLVDAFNPHTGWAAKDVIGIDVGITLLMIENHRSGLVWNTFMKSPHIQRAMKIANFRPHGMPAVAEASDPVSQTALASRTSSIYLPKADEGRPSFVQMATLNVPHRRALVETAKWQTLDMNSLEVGRPVGDENLEAQFQFTWDEQALYLTVHVVDDRTPHHAPTQHLVELFVDPDNDGLVWGSESDFQFGFGIPNQVWEWFGQRNQDVDATVTLADNGYHVKARVPFSVLNIDPTPGRRISASVAVQSDRPTVQTPLKLNWAWRPHIERVYLGELQLDAPGDDPGSEVTLVK